MHNLLLLLTITSLSIGCTEHYPSTKAIDQFIEQYDNHEFSIPKDAVILTRNSLFFETCYIVGKQTGNRPVYFVTYNALREGITKIDSAAFLALNQPTYYTPEELSHLVSLFRNYDFSLLGCDTSGNIFVNPFVANRPPLLMRSRVENRQDTIRKGHIYTRYRHNWYMNTDIGTPF